MIERILVGNLDFKDAQKLLVNERPQHGETAQQSEFLKGVKIKLGFDIGYRVGRI